MIIVTPYIVKPAGPNEIAKPTDGFTDSTDPQAWLLGRVNQLYASPSNPQAIKDYKGPVASSRIEIRAKQSRKRATRCPL